MSRRLAKTAIFGTPTRAFASKLPQLVLLPPMVHITTVYLPNCALAQGWAKSARRPYVGCVLARCHRVNRLNWAHTCIAYQRWLRQQWNSVLFSVESRFTIHRGDTRVRVYRRRNERYADCSLLERGRFGSGVLPWYGRELHMAFTLIASLSKVIWMPNATEVKFWRGMLSHCFKIIPISFFFSMIMPQAIQLGTLWFSLGRITLHLLMTGLPKALIWIPLNTFGINWISVLDVALFHRQTSFS